MTESSLLIGQLFNGISVASILLLAALGLALSFGLMGVINMAHGELLMMGGYLTYATLQFLPHGIGYPVGLIVAFVGTALFAGALEITLIRRLYGRPLDTLLATWGVSLILQQAARSIFGAIGVGVTAPTWLNHTIAVTGGSLAGLTIPATRIFIIAVAVVVLAALCLLLTRTRIGLLVR